MILSNNNDAHGTFLANIKRTHRSTYLALAKVHDLANNTNVGYIGNISTGGFMLYASKTFPHQAHRIFSIDFPHPTRGNITIQVGTRVAWQVSDSQKPKQQSVGCEILAIEPKDRLALLQSAKAYGIAA